MALQAAEDAAAPGAAAELTRRRLKELAQASSVRGLPTQGGETLDLAAYSEAHQRLYFFGQDASTGAQDEALHYITLSDLGQGVGAVRIGGTPGEETQDLFYGGTRMASLAFNPPGDRLLLVGAPSELPPYLGVMDLRGLRQQQPSNGKGSSRAPHRQLLPAEASGRLLQAAWHPLSRAHVVALLGPAEGDPQSPAEVHVYDVESEKREPEAVVEVDGDVAAFCFGPDSLWQRFTLYLAATGSGAGARMLALCPFVPQRAQVPAPAVKELQETVLEELALDKVQRRREELEAQWAWLARTFGDVVALARDKGEDFLSFRWVTSRVSMKADRQPALQEVEYPDPPANLTPRALGLLNPAGTLPALAVTYDSEALDVILVVSLVEPQWEEAADATGEPAHHWPLEARRLARLKTGHRGRGQEALPRIVLDPERHARGTVYVVRDQSVLRVTLPWVRRIEELGDEAGEEGADGRGLGRRPPGKARMREVHRLQGGGKEARAAGACMVYDASVGSLLVVRRRDAEVDVLNLAILPFVGGGGAQLGVGVEEEAEDEEEQEGAGTGTGAAAASQRAMAATARQFSNHVPLEAASGVDLEKLKKGYEAVLSRPSLAAGSGSNPQQLASLKQAVIEQVIIPLRALQTRMVVRADEVNVLYEKARAAAQSLHERLEALRAEQRRVQERVEAAEQQLALDQEVAALTAQDLEWVRGVITPREDRRFQEVQLAEARLRSLEERLKAVERWAQGLKENGAGGAAGAGKEEEEARRQALAASEAERRRLAQAAEELAQEVELLERALVVDDGENGCGDEALGLDFGAMRLR